MMTIKIAVRDLKPGDILEDTLGGDQFAAVLDVALPAKGDQDGKVYITLARGGRGVHPENRVSVAAWALEASVDVRRPDLTPAQRCADQLLGAVKAAHEVLARPYGTKLPPVPPGAVEFELRHAWLEPAAALIEQADPAPVPPTLDEALAALAELNAYIGGPVPHPGSFRDQVNALLERARRAGVLKTGAKP